MTTPPCKLTDTRGEITNLSLLSHVNIVKITGKKFVAFHFTSELQVQDKKMKANF